MQFFEHGAAANDTQYLPARHRTLPILASITPIANYPTKLRIFRTQASRYWQVRCFLRGRTYTQSLKTTNKQAAISQAKHFFHIKSAELYGEHITVREETVPLFKDVVPATLAQQQARVDRDDLTALSLSIFRSRIHNYILPFFSDMALAKINYQHLTDFVALLTKRGQSTTCQAAGTQFAPIKYRSVRDAETGIRRQIEVPKRVKSWVFIAENGKTAVAIRYGARVLELARGKFAVEIASPAQLIPTLELIKSAIDAGELDEQLAATAGSVRASFKRSAGD